MVHQKLKEHIIGGIFVRVTYNDELYVRIESYNDLKFEIRFSDMANKIRNGYTSDYAVYEIVKEYKKYVLERYFV